MKLMLALFVAIALFVVGSSEATAVNATNDSQAISLINNSARQLTSLQCDFVQTKSMSMLNEKLVSRGTLMFKSADKLRWEYTSPYKYLFIFNGSKVYVKNQSKTNVIDTKSNKIFKEVARIMMNTVTGKALSDGSDFKIEIADAGGDYKIKLTPLRKEVKQMFKQVVLTFSKSQKTVTNIFIAETNGDTTDISLKNIVKNQSINETNFAIPK